MKKILVAMMVVMLLVGGCSVFNQFLCNPTPAQVEAANVGKAVASAILAGASFYSGNDIVSLVNTYAIPVYDRVVAGYCVAQAEWDAATAAIEQANNQAAAQGGTLKSAGLLRVGPYDKQVAVLQAVKW